MRSHYCGTVTGAAAFNAGAFDAAYFDALGNLYAGDNRTGGVHKISTVQNVKGDTTAELSSQGRPSQGNDGALCQFARVKPDAGSNIDVICMTATAKMKTTQVSAIGWLTMAGNPEAATIARADSANTFVSGFSALGKHNFIRTNGGGYNDNTTSITAVEGCVVDRKTVYSNPASTFLGIRATGLNQVECVEIINATGSSVYKSTGVPNGEINVKTFAIPCSPYPQGRT